MMPVAAHRLAKFRILVRLRRSVAENGLRVITGSVGAKLFAFILLCTLHPAAGRAAQRELVDLSLEELSSLKVTSVSRRPEQLADAAASIQVITAEDIRRSGATRIPEALRLASNLQVAQISGDGWAISARGFNTALANKLLVMIDGRTIYTPLFAGMFWEAHDVPLYDAERIEVVSGPGGTLWGANAVNGVINIVTRGSADTQGLMLRGAAGNELRGAGALRYGGTLGTRGHFRVYGQYAERDGVELASGADAPNDSQMGQLGFRMDWSLNETDSLTVQGDANESRTHQAQPIDAVARSRNMLARWNRRFASGGDLQLQAYVDVAERRSPNAYTDSLATADLELQHHFRAGENHDIVWGLTFRSIDDDFGNILFAMDPASTSLQRWGGYVQDEISLLSNAVRLTIGTKIEDNEYTGAEWQPSARLSWHFREGSLLWGAVSRAVRTPARIDRDLNNGTSPPFTLGNDRFESETLVAYELGLRLKPTAPLSVSLATYFNDYDDLRSFEPANPPAPLPFIASNRLEAESYGAELSAEYLPNEKWRLYAGYSYLHLDLEPEAGSLDPTRGATEARDWKHQLTVRGCVDLTPSIELDVMARRIGAIDNLQVPAYTELAMRLGWRMNPALELSLVGRNLLHGSHGEFGPIGRLQIERSLYAMLTWQP